MITIQEMAEFLIQKQGSEAWWAEFLFGDPNVDMKHIPPTLTMRLEAEIHEQTAQPKQETQTQGYTTPQTQATYATASPQ